MRVASWALFAVLLSQWALALPAAAGPLLYPNGQSMPGELGYLLGGAYVALANGGEAVWYNPAGLADAPRRRLTVGGDLLRSRRITAGGPAVEDAGAGSGSLAYADVLGRAHGFPRYALGFAFADVAQVRLPSRFDHTSQGTAADLPPGFPVPGSFDTDFPDGYRLRETGEAEGSLRVLAPSLGLAVAPADWLRIGMGLYLERLTLSLRSQGVQTFDGSAASGSNTLTGDSQGAWSITGDSLRYATALGVQVDLAGRLVLGLVWRSPTETLSGSGRLGYQRADDIAIGVGAPGTPQQETAIVHSDGLPFRLDAPGRVTLAVALRSDRVLVELDAYRVLPQATQQVLPATETQSPSTLARVLPPVETTGTGALGLALGLAWARSDRTSLVLGIGTHPSAVAGDDGVFRAVPVTVISGGVYHVRGDVSGSLGLVHRRASAHGVRFPAPDGSEGPPQSVDVVDVAIQAAGSLSF